LFLAPASALLSPLSLHDALPISGRGDLRSASLEVKIPAERFDEGLHGLTPLGKLESVNVLAEDVGEEFTDVTARMQNSRRLESRDRKSTRLNSSHLGISYAVFCL